jgi:hypothetical protein
MLFLLCLSLYKGVGTRSKAREVEDGGASRKEVVSSRAEEEKKKTRATLYSGRTVLTVENKDNCSKTPGGSW